METRLGSAVLDTAVALTRTNALVARTLGQALEPWEMTWPQALSLFVLSEQPEPISASRLVEQLGLGRTAMTSVVDRVERRGWVQRRPSPRDRRVTDLWLTDSGRATVLAIRPVIRAALAGRLDAIDPETLQRCHSALTALTTQLRRGAVID